MMKSQIDETAIVHPNAKIAKGVKIGAYSIIEEDVEIGEDTQIASHVLIRSGTKMGKRNKIFQFNSIGEDPQHMAYAGQPTSLIMGDDNTVREFCTLNRGTAEDNSKTIIGNNNFMMAYVHISHDCVIANNTVFANNTTFGGHVHVESNVVIGGAVQVHQFCRIGEYSMIGGGAGCRQDVPPYVIAAGSIATSHGLNLRGLKRNEKSREVIHALKSAYKILFRGNEDQAQADKELKDLMKFEEVAHLVQFVKDSKRGCLRASKLGDPR